MNARPTSAIKSKAPAPNESLSERRKRIAIKGPEFFAKVYLPHLLVAQTDIYDKDPRKHDDARIIIHQGQSIDFADFHRELFSIVNTKGPQGLREAIIAPRGTAKSTIITIIVLYWASFKLRNFVLWTSETASQVEELVASLIDEIDANEELREDFPHLLPAVDPRGQNVKWTDRDLVMKSGFRLSARGSRKATRGLRRGGNRPDVVICDDAEGEDSVGETAYPKTRHWLTRVIGPALAARGDIIWMNTLVEWESITGALIRGEEDWTRTYTVRHLEIEWDEDPETGVKVDPTVPYDGDRTTLVHKLLWEEFWPQERIDAFREEFGHLAYMFELRNRPLSEGQKMFQGEWLKWATFERGIILREDKNPHEYINELLVTNVTAIDPAFGGKDFAAVVTVSVFNNDYFVREAWWSRADDIRTAQVEEAVRQAEYWGSSAVVVESVAAQVMVADETIKRTRKPVLKYYPKKNKEDRALPVAIRSSQGHVYFQSGMESVRALREILIRFPSMLHDDPVDAFVMAVEGAAEIRNKFLVST